MKKKTKRNPNDTTFRNINALKKKVSSLENDVDCITEHMVELYKLMSTKRKKK